MVWAGREDGVLLAVPRGPRQIAFVTWPVVGPQLCGLRNWIFIKHGHLSEANSYYPTAWD